MEAINSFRRLRSSNDTPDDAVRIRVFTNAEGTVAEVEWPANDKTDAGDYFYATYVPLALERALDVKENYGFAEIVVILDDLSLWRPAWGQLT